MVCVVASGNVMPVDPNVTAIYIPYGVPLAVTSLNVVNTPALDMLAIVVAPYLKSNAPPDSSMLKLVVASFATVPFALPVPPLAVAKVPLKVTAPLVLVEGVKPVVPALNEETPAAIAPI